MEKEMKGYLMTAVAVLVTIALYNSFFKGFAPASVRNIIGLG